MSIIIGDGTHLAPSAQFAQKGGVIGLTIDHKLKLAKASSVLAEGDAAMSKMQKQIN